MTMRYVFGDCELDTRSRQVTRSGQLRQLEPQAFDLLLFLIERQGDAITKDEIFSAIWHDRAVTEGVLTSRIRSIRRAIDPPGGPSHIRTLHRVGYMFETPISVEEAARTSSASQQPAPPLLCHEETSSVVATPIALPALDLPEDRQIRLPEAISPGDKPSIAVLPFANMSDDPDQEYFADGMTEDLITDLAKLPGLFVIARTSSFAYKGKSVEVREIANDLGVRYVLEGSVRRANERVRVTAQLIDAAKGHHLWAERYDREIGDIFKLQDELGHKIVVATAVKLSEWDRRRLAKRKTENVDAYDCLLRGREQLLHHTPEANMRAQELLRHAAKLDPTYAATHGHLAEAHLQQWQHHWDDASSETLGLALECAKRAVTLDDNLGLGHGVLGQVYLWQMRHEEAMAEGERRVALDPGDADGIATLAFTMVFSGLPEKALEMIERAMRLDPHYPFWHLYVIGLAELALGHPEAAVAAFKRGILRNPDSMPLHKLLAASYALAGEMDSASAEVAETLRLNPRMSLSFLLTQLPYRQPDDLARVVNALRRAGLPET